MQGDFITRNDDRLDSGYGSALLVDEFDDGFFNLVVPSESVPSVSGETETFEYNSLLSDAKSKVKGKKELSDATMEYAYSRENMLRLDKIVDRTKRFMRFNPNYTYEIFTAQISYKENDSEADVLKGELTIVPYSLDAKGIDGRPFIRQTLEFAGSLPDKVELNSTEKTRAIELSVKQSDASETYEIVIEGSTNITATVTNGKLTISAADTLTDDAYAMVLITAKSDKKMTTEGNTEKLKYAPWTMTVAVEYKA